MQLEERVAALEAEVARLKNQLEHQAETATPWWKKVAGKFKDNPAFEEAMSLGREYRESQRLDLSEEREDVST
ncbi:hypothetical protein NIES4071_62770 [Calothrix sp. NIES-4071]|nr:hypothetical protein NIES4071_62770 [Calothrix sp. NIES-4071]BAZ60580.1 hypothetical protein NIES4105_62720 [Calothrix sp. NIES-4105]